MQETLREHIEKIVPLTDEEFAFVLSHFTVKKYKKRAFLIEKGQRVQYAYFVVSGLLMLVYDDQWGKGHIVSFAMEDWWESDFLAYHTQTKATMSLQCLEDTTVFCLSLEDYQKVCRGLQKMEHFFLQKANAGHIASQQRILSFLTSHAKERYECKNIVRLNVYTTSSAELWPHFPVFQDWIAKHGIKQASTFMEVKSLFETLTIELEATVVK